MIKSIEKLLVTKEQALALKDLGFDEPCFAFMPRECNYYTYGKISTDKIRFIWDDIDGSLEINSIVAEYKSCTVPTKQQVYDWVREKYNINAWTAPYMEEDENEEISIPDGTYVYFIFKNKNFVVDKVDFLTHDEAETACIDAIIETIKREEFN